MQLAFVMILGASIERPLVFRLAPAWRATAQTQMWARLHFRRGSEVHCFHI
jgi:hypothetical protein